VLEEEKAGCLIFPLAIRRVRSTPGKLLHRKSTTSRPSIQNTSR
jgi:hypothetical protein